MTKEPRIPGPKRVVRVSENTLERDVDDELAFHIAMRARRLVESGQTENEARQAAESEFGDLDASRRELVAVDRRRRRRQRISRWAEALAHDVRYAVRSLRRSPAFAVTAVLTLSIGIGAAVAIFAVIDGVLLRPLPYKNPDRLVGAWHDFPLLGMTHGQQAPTTYFTYRTQAHTIEEIGVYDEGAANADLSNGAAVTPRRVTTALFSASLFRVLGVSAGRGHVFTESEDTPNAPPVVVISDAMWRRDFSGDAAIIGRRLRVDDVSREIIGVMPPEFRFPSAATQLWMPLALDPVNPPPVAFSYNGVARLKPGVSVADAQRDFAAVLPRAAELFPSFVRGLTTSQMLAQVKPLPVLNPWRDDITGGIAGTLWVMAGAGFVLLLVACANVANLTLVRADARQREIGVREALGAGRGRVMQFFISESVVLAGVAGILGLGAAWLTVRALVSLGPSDFPRLTELRIDGRAVLVAGVITTFTALVCSAMPMLRVGLGAPALREGGRSSTAGRRQHRARAVLAVGQIALCLVVLGASGLLLRSFQRLHAVRPGFDPGHVETLWMSLSRTRYPADGDVGRFYSTLVDRVAQLPGVTNVAVTSRLPLEARGIDPNPFYPEDDQSYVSKLPPLVVFTVVGGDYFRALRIPLLAGKLFDRMDTQRGVETIVSSRTAQLFWKDSTGVAALGKQFRPLPGGTLFTVVGVVGDARDTALAASPSPTVYFPETVSKETPSRRPARTMALVVRTSGEPTSSVPAVRQIIRELDPALPTFDVRTMEAALGAATARLAFVILILGGAAIVTLVLGAVGLYGVMAYVVTLRRRELSIRIALGATPSSVAAATTRQGLALAGIGVAAGAALFVGASRFMRSLLFGVAPWDPLTIAAATLLMLSMATLASWIPARQAGRVDPAEVLRTD